MNKKVQNPATHISQNSFPVIAFYGKHATENQSASLSERFKNFLSENTDKENVILSFIPSDTPGISDFAKTINESKSDCEVFISVPSKIKNNLTSWTTGIREQELQTPFLCVNRATLQALCNSGVDINNKYGFLFALRKEARDWNFIDGAASDKSEKTIGWKMRLKAALQYINPLNFKNNPARHIFTALSLLVLITITSLSKDAGISGDEFIQYNWADTAIIPYFTENKDAALFDKSDLHMENYGSSFDTFTAMLVRITGTNEIFQLRHFWNAVMGFLCIIFGALMVRYLTRSWVWACIGMVLLFFTPRLLGDSLNNPKDIPFAAGYIIGLYYALLYYGKNGGRIGQAVGIILGTGLAISIRIGGFVLIPTIALFAGLRYIENVGLSNFLKLRWKGILPYMLSFLLIALFSFILGIIVWPYGLDDPFTNPLKALDAFTKFPVTLRQLFEGKLTDSGMLPPYYLTKYLLITTPVISLLGLLLYFMLGLFNRKNYSHALMIVFFAAAFPIFYIWYQKSNVYGGMRQIMFVVPCIVVSATAGFSMLEKMFTRIGLIKWLLPGLVIAGSIPPAIHTFKNHPLQYIYFNELIGGTKGAYGEFEMDYYLASLRQSTEWFLENVARKNPNKKYTVLTYGMNHVKYYCRNDKNVHVGFTRADERSSANWDYAIFYNGFTDKSRLTNGAYPPVGTIYTPLVDGRPMGWVIKRPSFDDVVGFNAMEKSKNFSIALNKFRSYLSIDGKSSEVYFYLANTYANLGNLDSAIWAAEKSLAIYPESNRALLSLNSFYAGKGQWDMAVKTMDRYTKTRPADPDGWWIKAQMEFNKREYKAAEESLRKTISLEAQNPKYYEIGVNIYQALKDDINARLYYNASKVGSNNPKEQQDGVSAIQSIYLDITGEELDLGGNEAEEE
ncbi:MAG: tetratricopeptide repeat protein [Sphingomonadales bacterium]|nr:tetratricopeptide repeat protein [Sphingomonadales bacterium]